MNPADIWTTLRLPTRVNANNPAFSLQFTEASFWFQYKGEIEKDQIWWEIKKLFQFKEKEDSTHESYTDTDDPLPVPNMPEKRIPTPWDQHERDNKKRVKTLRKITQPTNQIAVTKSVQLQPWKIQWDRIILSYHLVSTCIVRSKYERARKNLSLIDSIEIWLKENCTLYIFCLCTCEISTLQSLLQNIKAIPANQHHG
jgi:hypothetical protein